MPHQKPRNIHPDIDRDHQKQTVGTEQQHYNQLKNAQYHRTIQVNIRFAPADEQIRVKPGNRNECAANRKELQQLRTGQPLVGNRYYNQFGGGKSQPEHRGKSNERGKSEHLAESAELPFRIVGYPDEHRLRHTVDHAGNQRMPHVVPFVRLIELSDFPLRIEAAEDDGKEIIVDMVEYIRKQKFAAEAEHLANRTEIESKGGTPRADGPKVKVQHRDIEQALRRQSPIRKPGIGKRNADNPGYNQPQRRRYRLLLHHQVPEDIGGGSNPQTGDKESQEGIAPQGYQFRLMVELGNQRSAEEQQPIEREAQQRGEPEHRIIILVPYLLLIRQCCRKAAVKTVSIPTIP